MKHLCVSLLFIEFSLFLGCTGGGKEKPGALGPEGVMKNAPPIISSISIAPNSPLSSDTLSAEAIGSDPDGVPVTFSYQWLVNGSELPGENGKTLGPGKFRKGDSVAVRVTPFDGKDYGETKLSSPVTVQNSPPIIESATILPENSTVTDTLTSRVTAKDLDGDPVTLSYKWVRNGVEIPGKNSPTLPASMLKKGDVIVLSVTPSDGELQGPPGLSNNQVRVNNSLPRITSSPPDSMRADGSYSYQVVVEDPDKDPLTFSLVKFPPGMSIDARTGLIQWKPTREQGGTHELEVKVEDGDGGRATQKYTLTLSFSEAPKPAP